MEKKLVSFFEKGDIVSFRVNRYDGFILCKIIDVVSALSINVVVLENHSTRHNTVIGERFTTSYGNLKHYSEKEPKAMIKEKEKFKKGDIVKWTVGEIAKWTKERVSGFLIGKIVSFYPNTYVDIVVLENHNEDPEYLPIGTITAVRLFNLEHYSEKSPKETCEEYVKAQLDPFRDDHKYKENDRIWVNCGGCGVEQFGANYIGIDEDGDLEYTVRERFDCPRCHWCMEPLGRSSPASIYPGYVRPRENQKSQSTTMVVYDEALDIDLEEIGKALDDLQYKVLPEFRLEQGESAVSKYIKDLEPKIIEPWSDSDVVDTMPTPYDPFDVSDYFKKYRKDN